MAGFRTHITVSTFTGIGYGTAAHLLYQVPLPTCILAGGLCSVAGMLPDLDSDSGVPLRESVAFGAAVVPMMLMERLRHYDLATETIVLVGFSPTDEARETNFRQRMGIDRSVRLLGPYSGALRDMGGSVQLLMPLADRSEWALVDRVAYDDRAPWPAGVRATGRSLQRRGPDAFGDAPQSWLAADPTPGSVQFTPLGDMDLSGHADAEDINGFVLALMRPQEYEADFGVPATFAGDLDQDGDVDFDDIDDFLARLSEPSGLTGALSRTGTRVTPTERNHRSPLAAKPSDGEVN